MVVCWMGRTRDEGTANSESALCCVKSDASGAECHLNRIRGREDAHQRATVVLIGSKEDSEQGL